MLNETRARELLHQAGESIPVGHQSSEEMLAGTRQAKRNRAVAQVVIAAAAVVLVVSGTLLIPKVWDAGGAVGAPASANRRSLQVTTPKVEGLFASQAYQTLRKSGLDVQWTNCASNASCPQSEWGKVLDQHPTAGTSLEVGSTVRLMVLGYGPGHGDFSPEAALTADGELALTLYNRSNGCPERPKSVDVTGDNGITVTTDPKMPMRRNSACYSNLRPFTSIVQLPAAIDTGRPVIVTVVPFGYQAPTRVVARPGPSDQAWSLCQAASRMQAEVLQAFLTTVKVVRHRTGGPPPAFSPAAKPWASLPADAPAAWCTVKTGPVYTVGAAGPDGEWVEFMVGGASVGTGPQGPAIP